MMKFQFFCEFLLVAVFCNIGFKVHGVRVTHFDLPRKRKVKLIPKIKLSGIILSSCLMKKDGRLPIYPVSQTQDRKQLTASNRVTGGSALI